jgi:FlaA1/EpsC-like NDP-sugar epimerase
MTRLDAAAHAALLGRAPEHVLSNADRRAFRGQRLLITGAGGSVGSELAEQLAACRPQSVTLLDHSEFHLFQVERALRERHRDVTITAVLGDVSRRVDVHAACAMARPNAIYHAAAYKHVPIAEQAIVATARVNVLGTWEVVRAAREVGARFVLISSDKAAEPRSVMGATKRLAEIFALGQRSRLFRPLAVRFGNILGSSGSVIEIMVDAVRAGRNVPVTAPDATRFFMTAEEAVSLILKADLMGRGGDVFWLEMGQPQRVGDLAERVIAWATPAGVSRVGIDIIGLRPGEKLREELTTQGLEMRRTSHPRIWSARQRSLARDEMVRALRRLRVACARGDAVGVLETITSAVQEYEPSSAAVRSAQATSYHAALSARRIPATSRRAS